jgi:hypothetical protein
MRVDPIQTSFAGGELGPSLFGRTDIAQYQNACETVENFICRPYGSAISTPGTEFIRETKLSALSTNSTVRLIKFVFSRTDAYVIEFGVGYFRFFTDGAVVVSTGTTPFEVAHTFTESELFDVQFAQINDVIYLVHPDHKPQKLTRLASNSWTLTDFDFLGGPFLDDNTTATTINASAVTGAITLSSSTAIFTVSSASTRGHVGTYWKIGAAITDASTGLAVQGYIKITAVSDTKNISATVIKKLADTAPTADWAEGAWSDVRGWPSCIVFHERRLYMARTDHEPQKIWGSQPFTYDEFSIEASYDDDALNLQLASNEANEIKWLASGSALIAGTYGGEFIVTGSDTDGITPSSAQAKQQTSWGSEAIIPKKIGNFFYYIQRFGKKIRELFYFWDLDTYKSVDKTIFSPHITGDGIRDMDYQQNPETILYCVTTGGTLSTLTREIDQEVQAWSRQVTDGYYESVAVIPSQDDAYDEVWVVVKRTIGGATKRFIERFKNIEVPDRQDMCWYVHSGLRYNAYDQTASPTAITISLNATAGSIRITASDIYFSAGDVGQRIRAIDADGVMLGEAKIDTVSSSTIVLATTKYNFSTTSYAAGRWGLSVSEISGLDHLEAKTVVVLADGGLDKPNKTVSSGTITLAYDYFVVLAGLPYNQTLLTLPIEAGSARGTAQGKIQRINAVSFKVNRSHLGFLTGGDEGKLEQINWRDPTTLMGTPELLYTGVIPNITFNGDYVYGSQVMIRNEDPLPVELLSVMPILTTEDK